MVALMVYASLYPFTDWRNQGLSPFAFLTAPWPRYWTAFDVGINLVGYAPLGFLLVLSHIGGRPNKLLAVISAALLSLSMETLQSYLPMRVPSNVDLTLNVVGAGLGASAAWYLERTQTVQSWRRLRGHWLVPDARGALVLLMLWPVALLFPASVPLGLGQVLERLEQTLAQQLEGTLFLDWLPLREVELQPLAPGVALICVALGALIPCLLGGSVLRAAWQRAVFAVCVLTVGVGATALSAALSYGPDHAWAWFDLPVRVGLALALVLACVLAVLPRRACAVLALLALVQHLTLLNQAPASAYFFQTLQVWEQGRFIRFNGLAQWLGWLWPYAALLYLLVRASRTDTPTKDKR